MNDFFADTSAILKRYVPEVGRLWVKRWTDPENAMRSSTRYFLLHSKDTV
jgi:predicted nucleic acid-binding protein